MKKETFFIKIINREVVRNKEWILRYKIKIMKVRMAALQAKIKHKAFVG